MNGSLLLQIGMGVALAAALLQFIADKSGNQKRKHALLVIAMIATAMSAFVGYWGNEKKEDEDKEELKNFNEQRDSVRAKSDARMDKATADFNHRTDSTARANKYERDSLHIANELRIDYIHRLAEFKMDNIHANYSSDMKEAFGILSKRTLENFIAEKIPDDLSLNETKEIINKTLIHYILNDFDLPYGDDSLSFVYEDSTLLNNYDSTSAGVYVLGCCINMKPNHSVLTDNSRSYWDLYLKNTTGPDSHIYVSVIINGADRAKHSFINNFLGEKSRDLYYKYGKWYESLRFNGSTHQTYHHLVIFLVDKKTSEEEEYVLDELNLWIGNQIQRPKLDDSERQILIYELGDVKKEKAFFK